MKTKFDHYKFNIAESNGVPIYWKNIPWANDYVYIRIIVGVGARHDPVGKEGLAHFVEHMPFDGCANCPTFNDVEDIKRELFQNTLGARTGFEFTDYYAKCATKRIEKALMFLGSFVTSPKFDSGEIERERSVICKEIWRAYGSERIQDLKKRIQRLFYGTHPLGRTDRPFGWTETVRDINQTDIKAFHAEHYNTRKTKILIVGKVTEADLDHLDILTQSLPIGCRVEDVNKCFMWPAPNTKELTISISEYIGLRGAAVPKTADVQMRRGLPICYSREVLSLVRSLLSEILFLRIRGQLGTTYSPRVTVSRLSDHSVCTVATQIDPENVGVVRDIISAAIREIAAGNTEYVKLFNQTRDFCAEDIRLRDLSADLIADNAARVLASSGRIKTSREELRNIERVTYEDVADLLATQFRPDQMFWNILTP